MAAPTTPRLTGYAVSVFIALTAIKAAYSLWRIIVTSAPDFEYYYQASEEAVRRIEQPIHLLPPASLLVYAPLQYVPYTVVQAAWVLLSFVCLIAVVVLIARSVGIRHARTLMLVAALSYLSFPTQFTLGMGQVNLLVLMLVVAAVFFEGQSRSWSAGVSIGLSWLLKPELLLLMPVLILCRKWRMIGASLSTLAVAVALSVGLWGTQSYAVYGQRLTHLGTGLVDAGIYYNQSLTGLMARSGVTSLWIVVPVLVGVFLVTCYSLWKNPKSFAESVWMYMPALLLIEPIAWQHHFVWLIPTYIMLWARRSSVRAAVLLAVSYFLISWNFASFEFLDTMPLGWLIGSHGVIGLLIVWIMTR